MCIRDSPLRGLYGRQASLGGCCRGARGETERRGRRHDPGSSRSGTRMTNPVVVALGGGHGLAASLTALRLLTDKITAVVTVADDGGSSGRLRDEFGCLLYTSPSPRDRTRSRMP